MPGTKVTESKDIPEEQEDLEKIREDVDILQEKRQGLLEKLRALEKERDHFREERDKSNTQANDAFGKVKVLKKKRDETNEEIRELKAMRTSVLEEMRDRIQKADELKNAMAEMGEKEKSTGVSSRHLRRKIKGLDWKLQTTPSMKIDEERQLIEQVNTLMDQLSEVQVSESKYHELEQLNRDIRYYKGYLDDSWQQFSELVSASQGRHQRLIELYTEGKEAKTEADRCHKLFVEKSEEVRKLRDDFRSLGKELRDKRNSIMKADKARRKFLREMREKETERLMEERTADLREKMSKGKKSMSLDEMRLLMDKNLLDLGMDEEE